MIVGGLLFSEIVGIGVQPPASRLENEREDQERT